MAKTNNEAVTSENIVVFTDRRDARHALNCTNVNHIECEEDTIRLSFMNELLKFDMKNENEAQKLFNIVSEKMR